MSTNVFTGEMSNELLHHVPGLDSTVYALSGVALYEAQGKGANWHRSQVIIDVPLPLPAGKALQLKYWAPFVTLNAINNDQAAINAGWAVDDFWVVDPGSPMRSVRVGCNIAVSDTDGRILRLGYTVQLVGSVVDQKAVIPK